MPTIYKYNQKTLFDDPDDAYTPEEIQTHYTQHFKELANATYTVIPPKKDSDEPRKVVFAKKVGTKG